MIGEGGWPPSTRDALISRIHATPTLAVLAVTGGGVAALGWLLAVPGASRTILEGTVPYAEAALAEYIGAEPQQSVSRATAQAMARAALRRAQRLHAARSAPLLGVGVTAALVSDRPKRGEHRAHVAIAADPSAVASLGVGAAGPPGPPGFDERGDVAWSINLDKGARSRIEEDEVVSTLVVAALAWACAVPAPQPFAYRPGDRLVPAWPGEAPVALPT